VHVQNQNHPTPLHFASLFGRLDIARVLLDYGATVNSEEYFGWTPLHLVAAGPYNFEQDRIRIAQLLLERGADVNAQGEDSETPLHLASYVGRVAIARVLLDRGAAANSKDNQGRTPLHAVAESYSRDNGVLVARLLLECGADVNVPDNYNQTPLHSASYFGRIDTVPVLLNAGADASAKNAEGQTPLHLVSHGPYYSQGDGVGVAQLLLEHGADVNAQDKYHATASDLALYHGRTKIASLLLHYGDKTNAKIDQLPVPRQLGLEGVQFHDEHCPSIPYSFGATVSGAWVRECRLPPRRLPRLPLHCSVLIGQPALTHFRNFEIIQTGIRLGVPVVGFATGSRSRLASQGSFW